MHSLHSKLWDLCLLLTGPWAGYDLGCWALTAATAVVADAASAVVAAAAVTAATLIAKARSPNSSALSWNASTMSRISRGSDISSPLVIVDKSSRISAMSANERKCGGKAGPRFSGGCSHGNFRRGIWGGRPAGGVARSESSKSESVTKFTSRRASSDRRGASEISND